MGAPATTTAQEMEAVTQLRQELEAITTPAEALDVRDKAERMREALKLMNKSVEECNEFAEIYMLATWRFGDLVKDIEPGGQEGNQNAVR